MMIAASQCLPLIQVSLPPDSGGLLSYASVSCRLFAHNHRLSATANALLLQKSLERRLWDNSKCQVPSVDHLSKARHLQPVATLLYSRRKQVNMTAA